MNRNDRNTGSSFDSFLEEEGIRDEVEAVAIKRVVAWQLTQAMKAQNITKHAMAEKLHTSRSQVNRLLDPENASINLITLARAVQATGMHIEMNLVREAAMPARTANAPTRPKRQLAHA
jgi:predicted XRE-type DNA-binding protein